MVLNMYEQKIKSISADDLLKMIRKKEKALTILDAREVEAFDKGHIPGACDMFDPEIMSIAKDWNKNTDICVYGPGQATPSPKMEDRLAGDAVKKLTDMGFKNVCVLNGGFESWANSGHRVDSSKRKLT